MKNPMPNGLAISLALLVLAGCGKPGDQGGGTTNERSMGSAASTPSPSRPEPNPGTDVARAGTTAPLPASGAASR